MSQITSESVLTTKAIVEQAIKDYHKQILPYLNGEFPISVAERFAEENIYSTDEKIIGQWIDGKPLYQIVCDPTDTISDIDTVVSKNNVGITDTFILIQNKSSNATKNVVTIKDKITNNVVYTRDFTCDIYGVYSEVTDEFIYNNKVYEVASKGTSNVSAQAMVKVYLHNSLICENWSICSGSNTSYPSSGTTEFSDGSALNSKVIYQYTKTTD